MKYSKPQHLLVLNAPVKFGRSSHLGVTVGFGFRLSDPRILAHETEIWSALEGAPMSFKALDEAMPKAFAEWLMAGHAQQVSGRESIADEWRVHVSVGDCHKEIQCHSPAAAPTGPAGDEVRRVALDYVNAYGGEGFLPNPVGLGHANDGRPAIKLPAHYGTDHRFSAATGPQDTRWAQRSAFVSRKKKDLSIHGDHRSHLGWPENMDRRFFQMAPSDQWSRAESWPADCSYALSGVGERGMGFDGRIPPLEAQAIFRRVGEQSFQALPLRRQTLWFFPDRNLGAVLFSGLIDVEDMLADEIDHMLVALAECGTPYPLTYLSAVANAREAEASKMVEGMKDDTLMPPAGRGWAWEYLLSPEDHPNAGPEIRNYQQVRERMRKYMGVVASAATAAAKAKEQNIDDVKQQTRALMRGEGLPTTDMDKMDWRRELESWPKEKRRDDLTIRNADLSGMDFSGQSWQGVQLINVQLKHCRFQDADLRNLVVVGGSLEGAGFENAVLDSCHFSDCELVKSRWQDCQLSVVQFVDCALANSSVRGGHWKNCFISGGRGGELSVEKAHWESVQIQECDLPSASFVASRLDGQIFLDSKLPSLAIRDSTLNKASWVACQLIGSQFLDSRFLTVVFADKCTLSQSRWKQCVFEKVFLGDAAFDGGVSERCTWVEATMNALDARESQWIACDMRRGNLMHANLCGARMDATALKDANLYGADLTASEFHSCNLIGANLGFVRRETNWQKRWKDNLMGRVIDAPRRPD